MQILLSLSYATLGKLPELLILKLFQSLLFSSKSFFFINHSDSTVSGQFQEGIALPISIQFHQRVGFPGSQISLWEQGNILVILISSVISTHGFLVVLAEMYDHPSKSWNKSIKPDRCFSILSLQSPVFLRVLKLKNLKSCSDVHILKFNSEHKLNHEQLILSLCQSC